jgi:L-ascorbate metabolism protein UlaG (beta-lactamase superfamily)
MHVRFLGHSAFLLEFSTGNVLVDPNFNCHSFGNYRRMIPAPIKAADLPPISLILITQEHEDHFDKKTIEELVARDNASVVAHDSILSELNIPLRCKRGVGVNAKIHLRGVEVKVHSSHHPQAFYPMSYMITSDNIAIYHAGDSHLMEEYPTDLRPHVALLPIGGNITMDIVDAVKATKVLKPDVVVPMHYNTFEICQASPEEFARKYTVIPISLHFNTLKVAMSDPTDLVMLDNLRQVTGYSIEPLIATKSDIEACITQFYKEGSMLKTAVEASYSAINYETQQEDAETDSLSLDNIVASTKKAPVVNLTDLLILQAVKDRASDIHIEPYQDRIVMRFRIDGVLHEMPAPDKSMMLPLISRIKILAKMDISEKRLPQDGNLRAAIENREVDFRVSTIPTIYGEKVVMRILDRSSVKLSLEALGFNPDELAQYRRI